MLLMIINGSLVVFALYFQLAKTKLGREVSGHFDELKNDSFFCYPNFLEVVLMTLLLGLLWPVNASFMLT